MRRQAGSGEALGVPATFGMGRVETSSIFLSGGDIDPLAASLRSLDGGYE